MTINALLLIDGVASHGHQSRGLVCELARHAEVNVVEFIVQMHSNWMRGYLRKNSQYEFPADVGLGRSLF